MIFLDENEVSPPPSPAPPLPLTNLFFAEESPQQYGPNGFYASSHVPPVTDKNHLKTFTYPQPEPSVNHILEMSMFGR